MIQALRAPEASVVDQRLVHEFELAKREAEGSGEFIRGSGRFGLTAVGDLNTYALFAEHFLNLIAPHSRAGLIVPTGIATDNGTKAYFEGICTKGSLVSLVSFENEAFIFREVHHSFKFCAITLRSDGTRQSSAQLCFFIRHFGQLSQADRLFSLTAEDITLLNPNTHTCPVFRSQMDADLTKRIYKRVPVMIDERNQSGGNPWGIHFHTRLFHMAEDSHLFYDAPGEGLAPLYEAKLLHLYDHRWATYRDDGVVVEISGYDKTNPSLKANPRYWVSSLELENRLKAQNWSREWLIGWRDITNSIAIRTVIPGLLPRTAVGHKFPLLFPGEDFIGLTPLLLGCLSSLVCDYCTRQKVGGNNMQLFIVRQMPVPPPSAYDQAAINFIQPHVLELTYTAHDLKPWAEDLGYDGPPFFFDPERRALLRAELDAFYAHLYGLSRDELLYILDPADVMGPDYPSETFRVLKNNEIRQFGEYRTQRLVLEAWDRLFG
jgi:hypothetical protein